MVKYFSFLFPLGSNFIIQRNPGCLGVVKGRLLPYIKQKRGFADKGKDKDPAKEEQMSITMPGFVHPENMKEEGYFTQKAKKQLEELKRKPEDAPVHHNPEKKM